MDNISELTQQDEDRINRYLTGQMSREEETNFETALNNDSNLREHTRMMARMVKAMDAIGSERDKEYIFQMKSSVPKKNHTIRWISVAASFALLITIGYQTYEYNRIANLGKEYAMAFPMSEIIRGEEDEDVKEVLTTLFNNVANGTNLKSTIIQLEELWELSQSDTYNDYTTYAPFIGWNLAIAHLRNHDKKKGKEILDLLYLCNCDNTILTAQIIKLRKKI